MIQTIPTKAPAGFVPEVAVAYADSDGAAIVVDASNPLPVSTASRAATSAPLAGTATESVVAGPFAPDADRPIWLTLSGTWSGTVTLNRSLDGGTTLQPITAAGEPYASYTGNVQEPVVEDATADATYFLDIALVAGSISYRVQQ